MFPRPIALLLALLALAAPPASSSPAAPPRVLAEGAVAEKIAAGFGHAEGPLWMPEGFLIFCDTTANRLLRFDDARGLTIFREPCGRATGLGLDPQDR